VRVQLEVGLVAGKGRLFGKFFLNDLHDCLHVDVVLTRLLHGDSLMGTWSLVEKIVAGLAVVLIGSLVPAALLTRWRRRRRFIVKCAGTGETYVSAGIGRDKTPDVLVKNQWGQLRICVETQPMGHVAFRFMNPRSGGVACTVIVMAPGLITDVVDHAGIHLRTVPY
jgi:hypothetical protein